MAAGVSHYWSVRTFISAYQSSVPSGQPGSIQIQPPPARLAEKTPPAPLVRETPTRLSGEQQLSDSQRDFFENLIAEMRALKNENRDLRDQIGETNRDLMKLEFRVDTHSESFRPLPVSEQRFDTSFDTNFGDDLPGVLPPRALPAFIED